jgi:hypothetical protein
MTVPAGKTPYHRYSPGAAMAPEAIPFDFGSVDELLVGVVGGAALAYGSDYAIAGDPTTGTATITALINAGSAEWELWSETAAQQQLDTADTRVLDLAQFGRELDRVVRLVRETAYTLGRAALAPRGESGGLWPALTARAGKFFGWDADGNPAALSGTGNDAAFRTDAAASGGASLIGYLASGIGAVARSLQAKLREWPSITDYLPAGYVTNGTVDYSTYLQAAHDAVASAGGGVLWLPRGAWTGNLTVKPEVTLRGAGMYATRLLTASATHGVQVNVTASATRIALFDLSIEGNLAHANCDGINLTPVAPYWVDKFTLKRVRIIGWGRSGIRAVGTSANAPFVQQMLCENVESINNKSRNLDLVGTIIETSFKDCSFCDVTDVSGAGKPVNLEYNGDDPARAAFINCLFSNGLALAALGGAAANSPAVYIGGGSSISFSNCDFEHASPHIEVADFSLAEGFSAHGCSFANSVSIPYALRIWRCAKLAIDFCWFNSGAGTLTSAIRLEGEAVDTQGVSIGAANRYTGTITNKVSEALRWRQVLASDSLVYYRDTQVAKAETGSADNLATIKDSFGGTTAFKHGDRLTVFPFTGETLTVKHGTGNIMLANAVDAVLTGNVGLLLAFDVQTVKWVEIGRTAPYARQGAIADTAALTYAAPAGGATVDSQARASLAQLATDAAAIRTGQLAILAALRAAGLLAP